MEQTPGSPIGSSSTSGATPQSTTQELKGKAQQAAREAKGKAQQTAQRLKEQGKQQLESGKEGAASKAEQLADAVNRASDELHQHQEYGLADYASQVASGITRFADTLRNRSIDDLIDETQSMARRNPTIFFLGSIGLGLALSRFLKASARNDATGSDYEEASGASAAVDVSYDAGSEWQQPEASSIYGGQPGSSEQDKSEAGWPHGASGNDFDARPGSASSSSPPIEPEGPSNNPPGGTYL